MRAADELFDLLAAPIGEALAEHPEGLSEHALMRRLAGHGFAAFDRPPAGDMLALFRCHFLLFHVLYRLRDRLRREGRDLHIHCSRIALETGHTPAPTEPDRLRAYYLDPDHLRSVTAQDVAELLNDFRLRGAGRTWPAPQAPDMEESVDCAESSNRSER